MKREVKVYTFKLGEYKFDTIASFERRDRKVEGILSDGWQLDNQIVCPPNVMLFFSREKTGDTITTDVSDTERLASAT